MALIPVLLYVAACIATVIPPSETARPGIDVLRYAFAITLSDDSDVIEGDAEVTVRFTDGPTDFYLDFDSPNTDDTGMSVVEVTRDGEPVRFEHTDDRLWLHPAGEQIDSVATFEVKYRGTPADGLIISNNRYGDRTFFADNWPNRARKWIPTVDVPSDKAFVDFIVTAPARYQVISNGRLVEESDAAPGFRITHWSSTHVLPTKIMVIGVARFAVQYLGDVDGIPLETWVYPQARDEGFYDFAIAEKVVGYLTHMLGPFPFSKLANVQSTTRYGAMENASAIFYDENAVTGTRANESNVAHEIAHQWFGDSASEEDYSDVWLSEGFATYLAHLYFEHYYGAARLAERMDSDRTRVIRYAIANPSSAVVDATVTDPNALLNTNAYEKGGWTLHMLRRRVGDAAFWEILREYYRQYRYGNATTADFRMVAESVSKEDLGWFFDQWIYRPGVPIVGLSADYDAGSGEVVLEAVQNQPELYRLPLEVEIETSNGQVRRTVDLAARRETFRIAVDEQPISIHFDPDVTLLAWIVSDQG